MHIKTYHQKRTDNYDFNLEAVAALKESGTGSKNKKHNSTFCGRSFYLHSYNMLSFGFSPARLPVSCTQGKCGSFYTGFQGAGVQRVVSFLEALQQHGAYHCGLTQTGNVSSSSYKIAFTSILAPLEAGLAIPALTVTLVYQRWTRAAVSPLLVIAEMWTRPHSFFFLNHILGKSFGMRRGLEQPVIT